MRRIGSNIRKAEHRCEGRIASRKNIIKLRWMTRSAAQRVSQAHRFSDAGVRRVAMTTTVKRSATTKRNRGLQVLLQDLPEVRPRGEVLLPRRNHEPRGEGIPPVEALHGAVIPDGIRPYSARRPIRVASFRSAVPGAAGASRLCFVASDPPSIPNVRGRSLARRV